MNRAAKLILAISIAFLAGRLSATGVSFEWPSFGSIVSKPKIVSIAVIEEVTARPVAVAKLVNAGWFADQQERGIKCAIWDDNASEVAWLKPKIAEAGGVAVVAVIGSDKTLIGIRKIVDSDSIESIEEWILGVGKYGD